MKLCDYFHVCSCTQILTVCKMEEFAHRGGQIERVFQGTPQRIGRKYLISRRVTMRLEMNQAIGHEAVMKNPAIQMPSKPHVPLNKIAAVKREEKPIFVVPGK